MPIPFEVLLSSYPMEIKTKIMGNKDLLNMLKRFFTLLYIISFEPNTASDRLKEDIKKMNEFCRDGIFADDSTHLPILIKMLWMRARFSLDQHITTTTDTDPRSLFRKICNLLEIIDDNNEALSERLNFCIFKLAEILIQISNMDAKKVIILTGWESIRHIVNEVIPNPTEEWQRKAIEELNA